MNDKQIKLAWLLETAEAIEKGTLPARLDMKAWGVTEMYAPPDTRCPTAACLAGNFILMHPDCGMKLGFHSPPFWSIGYGVFGGMTAMIVYFDFMDEQDVTGMFDPFMYDNYGQPAEVVARVRATVARYQERINE